VFLLALVDKGQRVDISQADRNALRDILGTLADEYREGVRRKLRQARPNETPKPQLSGAHEEPMTTLGKRLLQAAEEARTIARDEADPSTYKVHVPAEIDVKAIRQGLGMTQAEFSARYGFPLGTLRDWEQGKGKPDTSARVLLLVISKEPQAVERALHAA
jgi:putative transcriptional regulator